ncbi:MAG: polysulfide reductase NrfD [Ilumatobacter sp.]|nr:polysulfide reductase NrfD [Ilumatobacter sp.]MDG2040928.1 polysulfide reductase NrfD [Ilumatobacter sp.]
MGARTTPAPLTGYEDQVGANASPWRGATATADIALNNLGVGTFIVVTIVRLIVGEDAQWVVDVGWPLAVALVALDLAVLALDLGDPWRVFHMLRVIKLETPMSVGVWALSAFMACAAVPALVGVVNWFAEPPSWIGGVALVMATIALMPAFGGLLYKGVLFSTTAQPGWRDARWLGAYLCTSGLWSGASVSVLIAVIVGEDAVTDTTKWAAAVLAVLSIVPMWLLREDLEPEMKIRYTPRRRRLFAVVALVIPVAVAVVGVAAPAAMAALVGLMGALIVSWVVRSAVVDLPQSDR